MSRSPQFLYFCLFILSVSATINEYSFAQRVDHFDPENKDTFNQYYWVLPGYYEQGGPAIVYLSNFPYPSADLGASTLTGWAMQMNALLIEFEVRYSGGSDPTANFTESSFRFQTPEQNIADIITFRAAFAATFPQYASVPWILVGEYYNGNFAMWAREKYPNAILGAVPVGAPVLSVENFHEYFEFWAKVAGATCSEAIHNATVETELALQNSPAYTDQIKATFGCTDVPDDTQFFYVIAQVLQYGLNYHRSLVCGNMDAIPAGSTPMDQYASVITQLLSLSGQPDCSSWNIAEDTNPNQSYRPTFYLDCGSFGQFETGGTGANSIASSSLTVAWYLSICYEVFGVSVSPDTETVNVVYGATRPWGSNYAFVSSLSDPYQSLQVNQTTLDGSQVFYVDTIDSIFDFISGPNVGNNVVAARAEVGSLMSSWVNEWFGSSPTPTPTPSTTPSPPLSPSFAFTVSSNQDGGSGNNDNGLAISFMIIGLVVVIFITFLLIFIGFEVWKKYDREKLRGDSA